jgi:hypothetical protein
MIPGWLFGQLVISTGATKHNWVNNGTFIPGGGTILFAGATQSVSGTSSTLFNNLTVISGSTTNLSTAGDSIRGVLLCNGTLNAGGNITLLSTAGQTALIDGSGSGNVLGNVTMQRYLPSGFGYKYFSSPFQAATVNEFSDEINLAAAFPTFYSYDENKVSAGWVNYTATSGALYPLQGYAANFGPLSPAITADMTGVVNNGNLQATLYNHNQSYTQGFNLAGNPYPSPINWDAGSGWTKTNIDNALYYFSTSDTNQYTGTYSSYINSVSSDGIASATIAAMQGFFIHVSNGSYPVTATLGLTNVVRVNNLSAVFLKSATMETRPVIRLTARFEEGTTADPVVFYFDESASLAFEKNSDALKLMNTDLLVPNLYSLTSDAARLSISALPYPYDHTYVVPLGLKTEKVGWIIFHVRDMEQLPAGLHLFLVDAGAKINQDLTITPQYRFFAEAGVYETRFSLVFSLNNWIELPDTHADGFTIDYSGGEVRLNLNLPPGENGTLQVCNIIGQVMWRKEVSGNESIEISSHVSIGIYVVSLFREKGIQSEKIFIQHK